ncbi:MAG: dihydroorotate dehydrogenase electron transfer subunit [Candidatus Omnitrophica bacterium]|nr:dihydroorotate dehydrogenase electron transfer subunit [Candidatus Omnitrophota bacterium]
MENIRQLKVRINNVSNQGKDTYLLDIESPYLAKNSSPGNFIHIKIKPVILRRPFSIHRVEGNSIFVLFKKKGRGTSELASIKKGEVLDVIGPLGRGFNLSLERKPSVHKNIILAGGIGVAPLVFLAEKLGKQQTIVLLGAKDKKGILCEKDFKKLGCKVHIATEDGSKGFKGTVLDLLKSILRDTKYEMRTTIYACGPKPMLYAVHKAIKKYQNTSCQVSFEQFMGCGLGFCCGCVIKTKTGYKKVCKDGPVFDVRDIW